MGRRPSVLFVSKMEQRWHTLFKAKFYNYYDLHIVYIVDHVQEEGYVAFVAWLNDHILNSRATLIFLDIEFFLGFGLDLIRAITSHVRVVLVTFDDIASHEMNYINSLGCDLVTCGDPVAVMKYQEKMVRVEPLFLENSRRFFDEVQGGSKDIEVLFFGDLTKGGRKEFIDSLTASGIKIVIHAPSVDGELAYPDLVRLICRAKVVLNFSKTHAVMGRPEAFVPVSNFLQFKGRVIEAGLGEAACVSEYAPAIECLFGSELVPMFRTVDQCAEIIRGLLNNPVRLTELSGRLRAAVLEKFEEAGQVQRLVVALESLEPAKKEAPGWIPYRYISATARARFLAVRRPMRAWVRDLVSFLVEASVYPLRLRLLVFLEVVFHLSKRFLAGLQLQLRNLLRISYI